MIQALSRSQVDNQSVDRAYRIGQSEDVVVRKPLARSDPPARHSVQPALCPAQSCPVLRTLQRLPGQWRLGQATSHGGLPVSASLVLLALQRMLGEAFMRQAGPSSPASCAWQGWPAARLSG